MVVLVLYTTVLFGQKQASYFSCVVFLSIVINHVSDLNPYLFVWNRFLDTMIGICVGVCINCFSLHRVRNKDILDAGEIVPRKADLRAFVLMAEEPLVWTSGLFVPDVTHGVRVEKGEIIGKIVDPLNGIILDEVRAPQAGMLFTIRDYPIVDEGSLMGRILKEEVCKNE